MKNTFTILFLCFLSSLLAQSQDSLTYREAFDFAINDTFQYYENRPQYTNGQVIAYPQVVIKNKIIDTVKNKVTYILLEEEMYVGQTGINQFDSIYNKSYQIKEYNYSNTNIVTPKCSVINPTPLDYCWDSLKIDYGNRKTLKHALSKFETIEKIDYAQGLGEAVDYFSFSNEIKRRKQLTYYNQNGQKWGQYSASLDTNRNKGGFKQLLVKDVYDFDIGDVFHYQSVGFFNERPARVLMRLEKRTILTKNLNAKKDTLIYTYKREYSFSDSFKNVRTRIDTMRIANLDSVVLFELKENHWVCKIYFSERYTVLKGTNRHTFAKNLVTTCIDLVGRTSVGQGIGLIFTGDEVPAYDKLVYFKKGKEEWGKEVDFSTSLFTPSVSLAKMVLSPNPANDILNIKTDAVFDKIQIINIQGQVVLTKEKTDSVDISQLTNGIYFLQIYEGLILRGVEKFVKN